MKTPNKSPVQPQHYVTEDAAILLCRKGQTLRKWACEKNGPITPVHVAGRLLWRRSDIEDLLRGESAE